MPTPEQKIKKQIKDYITRIGGFWSTVQGGPFSKPGDPDLICCVDGHYIGIEAKTPTGRASELQLQRGREIEKAGGIWILARSVEDVQYGLESRGIGKDRG